MWVRLSDDMPDHPKIAPLSNEAFRLFVTSLCYSGRYLTDGRVPDVHVRRYRKAAAELADRGLWAFDPEDACWHIHDWADYNPPGERVRHRRKLNRERQRRWREDGDPPPAP